MSGKHYALQQRRHVILNGDFHATVSNYSSQKDKMKRNDKIPPMPVKRVNMFGHRRMQADFFRLSGKP